MADEVKTMMGMTFLAFQTPDFARVLLPGSEPETEADMLELPTVQLEDLDAGAVDRLAAQWLDHLYARCERASPFKLVGA